MPAAELRAAAGNKRNALALEYDRVLTVGTFGSGGYDALSGELRNADASSQFGFDLTLLSLYTCLADARLPRAPAAEFSRQVGSRLLSTLPPPAPAAPSRLSELVKGMRACLDALQASGYMAAYTLDDSDVDDTLWAARSELSPTRLSVTLLDSASLRASLLLNGRAGASPEIARPLLTAYLRAAGADVTEAGEFFLDSTYRPNPLEYRPDQQVITLTVQPSAAAAATPAA